MKSSRIPFPIFLTSLLTLLIFISCQEKPVADLIIQNGFVWLENQNTFLQCDLAIQNEKIIATGPKDEVFVFQGKQTQILDATNQFVYPGLIDAHLHLKGVGEQQLQIDLLGTESFDTILQLVSNKVKQTKPGDWIIGRGWHQEKWNKSPGKTVQGFPVHDRLSQISPENPVILYHASGHALMANKKAMQHIGLTENKKLTGGEILIDANNQPTGIFLENAMALVDQAYDASMKNASEESKYQKWKKAILLAQTHCIRNGITGIHDAGISCKEIQYFKRLVTEKELLLPVWAMALDSLHIMQSQLSEFDPKNCNDLFQCSGIKAYADGALGSRGAMLFQPYDDAPDSKGFPVTSIKDLKELTELAAQKKYQMCTHAIGDSAVHQMINIYHDYLSKYQLQDARWRIEHTQHIDTSDIRRMYQLGIIASMQPVHCTSDAPFVIKRLGEKRAYWTSYPWRRILDAKVVICSGTDAPVEKVDPNATFYASITRKSGTQAKPFFADLCMTRLEALLAMTKYAAWSNKTETLSGTIKKGTFANFTILDKNWFTCPEDEIKNTQVIHTVIRGKIVYSKK